MFTYKTWFKGERVPGATPLAQEDYFELSEQLQEVVDAYHPVDEGHVTVTPLLGGRVTITIPFLAENIAAAEKISAEAIQQQFDGWSVTVLQVK